jgi:hypothetical protein
LDTYRVDPVDEIARDLGLVPTVASTDTVLVVVSITDTEPGVASSSATYTKFPLGETARATGPT